MCFVDSVARRPLLRHWVAPTQHEDSLFDLSVFPLHDQSEVTRGSKIGSQNVRTMRLLLVRPTSTKEKNNSWSLAIWGLCHDGDVKTNGALHSQGLSPCISHAPPTSCHRPTCWLQSFSVPSVCRPSHEWCPLHTFLHLFYHCFEKKFFKTDPKMELVITGRFVRVLCVYSIVSA